MGTLRQEPITRSVQLPHVPVMAFSQTDLFLVWIYREFRPSQHLSDQSQARTKSSTEVIISPEEVMGSDVR